MCESIVWASEWMIECKHISHHRQMAHRTRYHYGHVPRIAKILTNRSTPLLAVHCSLSFSYFSCEKKNKTTLRTIFNRRKEVWAFHIHKPAQSINAANIFHQKHIGKRIVRNIFVGISFVLYTIFYAPLSGAKPSSSNANLILCNIGFGKDTPDIEISNFLDKIKFSSGVSVSELEWGGGESTNSEVIPHIENIDKAFVRRELIDLR